MTIPEIEIVIHSKRMEVFYRNRRLIIFGIKRSGKPSVTLTNNDIDFEVATPFLEFIPLDFATMSAEKTLENSVALPRMFKRRTQTEVIKTPRATPSNNGMSVSTDSIDSHQRNQVLDAILDSLLDEPTQTKKQRAEATKSIAERFSERPMAVAGVRAAYTRGTYGDPDKLLDSRRKQRLKSASS